MWTDLQSITDLEDLHKKLEKQIAVIPLLAELAIFRNREFLSDEQIVEQINLIRTHFPNNRRVRRFCSVIIKHNY